MSAGSVPKGGLTRHAARRDDGDGTVPWGDSPWKGATLAAAAVCALTLTPAATGGDTASRLIDRTVVCAMPGEGFPDVTRFMTVSAIDRPPWITVSNGPSYELRTAIRTRAGGREPTGAASFHRESCADTTRRVAVTARGLRTATGAATECDVPGRVLIRIRARFRRPTGWVRDRETRSIVHARGPIQNGSLTVTTLGGQHVAFASVDDTRGSVKLLVSPSRCRKA